MNSSQKTAEKSHCKKRFRPFRVSLRSLIVALTCCSVVLAWYGTRMRSAEAQRRFIEALAPQAPGVVYDGSDVVLLSLKGSRVVDSDLKGISCLKRLEWLDLADTSVSDAILPRLRKLQSLKTLSLDNSAIGDQGVREICRLHKLERLHLAGTRISDSCLKYFNALPQLTTLDIGNTRVGDQGIDDLARMPNLRRLYIRTTNITDRALDSLEKFPQLRLLALNHTLVTDRGLAKVGQLQHLETLWLHHTAVTDAGMRKLGGLAKLRQLTMGWRNCGQPFLRRRFCTDPTIFTINCAFTSHGRDKTRPDAN
jgi:hypothetical protein